ncbi:hypothetical protein [Luteibacter sp. Lutesp34]|uniref:hypothetical protein n=1 Tax=Luteibacter sp. Lutesp34 TaxID=3243030 RepID=UPI0039B60A71
MPFAFDPAIIMSTSSSALASTLNEAFPRTWIYPCRVLWRVFLPFFVTRLLITIILSSTPLLLGNSTNPWNLDDASVVRLSPAQVKESITRGAIVNDAAWYQAIAQNGYEKRPFNTNRQANWAFFPLHPLIWRAMAAMSGEWVWSGVLTANTFFFAGLVLLWQIALRLTNEVRQADATVMFACIWPTSYFMSLPLSESLFFLTVCGSFLAVSAGKWGAAGVIGALASATRFNGLFLLPALAIGWLKGDRRLPALAGLAAICCGVLTYMVYLWLITGNPLAFKDIQVCWGRHLTTPWTTLFHYLGQPHKIAKPWNFQTLNFLMALLAICSILSCWRRGWRELAVFSALTLLAPLSTGTLTSLTRYLSVAPGIFVALATWAYRFPRLGQWLIGGFCFALALMCVLFSQGVNVAGA